MKKFKFRLEGLYRLRKEEERQALFLVQELRQKEIFLLQEIRRVGDERQEWTRKYNGIGLEPNSQSDLFMIEQYFIVLEKEERTLQDNLTKVYRDLESAVAKVKLTYRARRQIERLKEKQQEEYDAEIKRKEMRDIDEFNALNFVHRMPQEQVH